MIALLIAVQAIAWLVLLALSVRWAVDRGNEPELARPHLWIVPSDHTTSGVRALRDAGPYDWSADEPAGGAA